MKVLIEEYKKFEIYFDNEDEVFYTVSNSWDSESKSKSFASIKKWIDNFILENNSFKPFTVITHPEAGWKEDRLLKIVGNTKDGRFMYEKENGGKAILSKYDEKDYIVFKLENESFYKEMDLLKEKQERQRVQSNLERKEILAKFNIETLRDLKAESK